MKNSRTLKSIIAITLMIVTLFTFAGCDVIFDYLGIKDVLTIQATYTGDPIEVGGSLNKEDIDVTVTRVNGITKIEKSYLADDFDVSPLDTSTAGDKMVQVIYTEGDLIASAMVTITVIKKAVPVSISATYTGKDLTLNGTLNKSDFNVVVTYDNGTTKPADSFSISTIDTTSTGEKHVTITYGYVNGSAIKTFTTTVKVNVIATLVGISASFVGEPLQVGDTFTQDRLLVQEVYDDGTKVTITDFEISTVDTSTAGTKTVAVSYQKDGQTYTANAQFSVVEEPVVLTGISATFTNNNFAVGDTLTTTDFTVTAVYSDSHTSVVTNFTITSPTTFTTSGNHTVTLSYTYEGITKTCDITINVQEELTLLGITAKATHSDFEVGEQLKLADFVVTAQFSYGSGLTVSDFTIVEPTGTLENAGQVEVELSYTFNGQTRNATLYIDVVEVQQEVANYGMHGILSKDGKSVKVANTAKVIDTTDLQIHFLELGNKYTGDSIYIKAGDTDILIDAGSRQNSATTIKNYINKYVTDGILEYVIATHADQDHIAGMVGNSSGSSYNGILYSYKVKTLIQFPLTGKSTLTASGNLSLYGKYLEAVEYAESKGANAYTALECWNSNNESTRFEQSINETGARRYYKLSSNVEMEILYNYYYEHTTSDENDYSVCVMFNQYGEGYDFDDRDNPENEKNVNHFLFTGDLEESGEKHLVQYNNLPEVVLYKAGHHGSKTSSTAELLSKIKPKVVCVCCCTGSSEYTPVNENQFPTQLMINRVAPYTDLVFATTVVSTNSAGYTSLNGNITLTCNNLGINITASNNVTMLKDTDWFKANRTCPTAWQ